MKIINLNDKNLYYIGGIVRDELLGKKSFDIDITYIGNAIEHCSKYGEVIRENPDFGTVKIKLSKKYTISNEPIIVDFASTRSEIYPKKGHLPVVEKIGCSLKEDVMRRDFTINSLAKSVMTGEIIDYTGGLDDLKDKKLRVLHDNSFIDDPSRIIRGLKFSVRFGFELEEHTKKLQQDYLKNINYDMSFKRIKKEIIETFNLNSQKAFEKFINEKIYKLITEDDIELPKINIEELVNKYQPKNVWLIYAGVIGDLSRLPLTKKEQKILNIPDKTPNSDFEIYKMFEGLELETILLYAILKNKKIAEYYIDNLSKIKIKTKGDDLKQLQIPPSDKYKLIFDEILKEKLKNPNLTIEDEIEFIKNNKFNS